MNKNEDDYMKKDGEIEEIKEILEVKTKEEEETVSIIFDGKQYSIRIPKKFVDRLGIDTKADKFKFKLKIPPVSEGNPEMTGEFIRG